MLTIYATVDPDGTRCLWSAKPRLNCETGWGGNDYFIAKALLLDEDEVCAAGRTVLRGAFPRGMKPGEIRKFKIPRLGE